MNTEDDAYEVSDALEFLDIDLTVAAFGFDTDTDRWWFRIDPETVPPGPLAGFDLTLWHHPTTGWTVAFGDHRHPLPVAVDAAPDEVAGAVELLLENGTG